MLGGGDVTHTTASLSGRPTYTVGEGGGGREAVEHIEEQLLRQAIAASLEAVGCDGGDGGTHESAVRSTSACQTPPAPLGVEHEHCEGFQSSPSSEPVPPSPGGGTEAQRGGGEAALFGDEPLPARLRGRDGVGDGGDDDEEQLMLETAIRMSLREVATNEMSAERSGPATTADIPPDFASPPAQPPPPDFAPVVD